MPKPNSHSMAVIGAGSWGTALALLLARNGVEVHLWGHDSVAMQRMREHRVNEEYLPNFKFPANIFVAVELVDALTDVQDILIVVPSIAFRAVLARLKPLISENARFVWGTKGLDTESGETLDVVAQRVLGAHFPYAILSGPSFAHEVAQGLPTAVTLASRDEVFADELMGYFRNDTFRLYKSSDMVGVELCGVMKNVLAIASGLSDGLQLGANARSALLTRGIAELSRLLQAAGGEAQTLMSLAGIGDIILTCTADQSRNRRFGMLVGGGATPGQAIAAIGQVVEGFTNTTQLHVLAQKYGLDMPIVAAVYRVLQEHVSPQLAAQELLARDSTGRWG